MPLALALSVWWQVVVLAAGSIALLRQWSVVLVLVAAATIGLALVAVGAPIPY